MAKPIALRPHTVRVRAPRELLFQMLSHFGRGGIPGADGESSKILSRDGSALVVEFKTKSLFATYTTIEQVRLYPPERIEFTHLSGPLTYAEEWFALDSVDSLDSLASVASVDSVDSLDSVDGVDSLASVASVDSVVSLDSVDGVDSLASVDSLDSVDSLASVASVDSLDSVGGVDSLDSAGGVDSADAPHTNLTHGGKFVWRETPVVGRLGGLLYARPVYERTLRLHMAHIKAAAEARAARSRVFPRG